MPVRIINVSYRDDLMKTANRGNPREEYDRGSILPIDRWDGVGTDCEGQMRRIDGVSEGGDVEMEFQRWERSRKSKSGRPTNKKEIHPRVKWGSSRDMKVIQGKAMPLLAKEEGDCMGEYIVWGTIRGIRRK